MADKTYGQIGFEAYVDHANWTTYDGKPIPCWDDALRADIKERWETAAKAVADAAVAAHIQKVLDESEDTDVG